MAKEALTEAGYTLALKREMESLERLVRYERKSGYWLTKLIKERATARRLRNRIQESEEAKAALPSPPKPKRTRKHYKAQP